MGEGDDRAAGYTDGAKDDVRGISSPAAVCRDLEVALELARGGNVAAAQALLRKFATN